MRRRSTIWVAAFVITSLALFIVALSNAAYEATSPGWLTFHVALRKAYGVLAFAVVGFALARTVKAYGRDLRVLEGAAAIGLYSALIEVGQRLYSGAREALLLQSFDVACGILGGALGAALARLTQTRREQ